MIRRVQVFKTIAPASKDCFTGWPTDGPTTQVLVGDWTVPAPTSGPNARVNRAVRDAALAACGSDCKAHVLGDPDQNRIIRSAWQAALK